MINMDAETHPIRIVEPFEVEFKKPNVLEKAGMEKVIHKFCYKYLNIDLLYPNIIHEHTRIRLKNPIVYQEIIISEFKATADNHVVGVGEKEGEKYLLQIW